MIVNSTSDKSHAITFDKIPPRVKPIIFSFLCDNPSLKVVSRTFQNLMTEAEKLVKSKFLDWTQRPERITQRIDQIFQDLLKDKSSEWHFNGRSKYHLCKIDEHALVKKMVEELPKSRKEVYILDIGAGEFDWGINLAKYIDEQESFGRGLTFHIFNVRGERFEKEESFHSKYCKIYAIGSFKIEEIAREFKKRNLFLEGQIDLIVSRWCFRHLVDPVGTFVQTFNLLRPGSGLLLVDGFIFLLDGDKFESLSFNDSNAYMIQLLLSTKAPFVTTFYSVGGSLNPFILKRPSKSVCQIPMSYHGMEFDNNELTGKFVGVQIGSRSVCQFKGLCKKENLKKINRPSPRLFWTHFYGDFSLFDWLKKNELLLKISDDEPVLEPIVKSEPKL